MEHSEDHKIHDIYRVVMLIAHVRFIEIPFLTATILVYFPKSVL